MSGGANIVEQYAGADVPARIELLIKYYPNFIRLVEGYEQSLSFIIKEEKAYARKSAMGDLGVRVQTSGTCDPTAKAVIDNRAFGRYNIGRYFSCCEGAFSVKNTRYFSHRTICVAL